MTSCLIAATISENAMQHANAVKSVELAG